MTRSRFFVYLIILIWLVLFAKSMQFQHPEFRPWEILYDQQSRRFRKNQRVEMEAIGDLGYKSWVRDLQQRRKVTFTTDRWGFRNLFQAEQPRIVVLGDSYAAGAGLSDDQTLTYHMTQLLQEPVYNFSMQSGNVIGYFLREKRLHQRPPKFVIYAPAERLIRPRPLFLRERKTKQKTSSVLAVYHTIGHKLREFEHLLNRDNGLGNLLRFTYHQLLFRLSDVDNLGSVDQQPVLYLDLELQKLHIPPAHRRVQETVNMLVLLANVLAKRGTHLIFCPIPGSGSIYPELFPKEQRDRLHDPAYLEVLVKEAKSKGLTVVDLRSVFLSNKKPYLYWKDDTHWNPRAVAISARVLVQTINQFGNQ